MALLKEQALPVNVEAPATRVEAALKSALRQGLS